MNFYLVFLFLIFLFLLFLGLLLILQRKKGKGFLARGVNLALFLITIPQPLKEEKEFSLQEYFKTVEQFYSSLAGLKESKKFKRWFLGNPYIVFETAVHRLGEEIHFYLAAPRSLAQTIEKQILGFWPTAQVQPVKDYNVFNPEGEAVGSVAYLAKNPVFPLQFYQEFSTDPIGPITSIFTKLAKEGEGAAIQLLIRPAKKTLKKAAKSLIESISGAKPQRSLFSELLFPETKKESQPKEPSQPTPTQEAQISAISQKASLPLFEVNLRILVSALNKERAFQLLDQFQSAFEQFNSPILNQIKFRKLSGKKLKKLFYNFSFRIFNEKEIILLSSRELAGLYHFPSPQVLTPHIKWLKAKQAPPPDNLPQEGILIGKSVFRGEEREVRMLSEDRRRHFYIVGQTGTGKSSLLKEMIRQDMETGKGLALLEPHGDLAEEILGVVPSERVNDVIYFNPGESSRPMGLNMLEYDPRYPESKTFVVNELLEIFEKLYNLKAHGFGGPMFEQYMRNALLLVMEDPNSGNTLIEVPRVLADADFRKYKLSKCKNILVKNFWELEAEKAGGEAALANMVPYITSKMNVFISNDLVRPIIGQTRSAFNFREIMDEGKILICNLSKGRLGDINSYLLGMILVGKILISALSRVDVPQEKRRDFYLYIDEFQNFTTDTINTILAEARKYRLNLIFAHQYIGQLSEETRKAIFGNVGSILAFRVGPEDAKYLVTQFEPTFTENDLVNFDNFNGALKLLIKGETSKPFNIVTYPPQKGDSQIAHLIREHSLKKYGKGREEVEEEIRQRLSKSYHL